MENLQQHRRSNAASVRNHIHSCRRRAKVTDPEKLITLPQHFSSLGNCPAQGTPTQTGKHLLLTPSHLRKAKLMFLFTRYPYPHQLRLYFPDVEFTKPNMAQMVKWFSNFREFFYIQVERHVRNRLMSVCGNAFVLVPGNENLWQESLSLHQTIISHFIRNPHIWVPPSFGHVISVTYKEFFNAIAQGRDRDASWKKNIYKVIARLDQSPPGEFVLL